MQKPRFLLEAEERAGRLGVTVRELLETDRERSRLPGYPGPDCLYPHEIVRIWSGEPVASDRLEHLDRCVNCAVLVAAASPKPELFEELLDDVRALAIGAEVRSRRRKSKQQFNEAQFSECFGSVMATPR